MDIKDFTRKIRLKEYFLDCAPESKLVKNKSSFTPPRGRNTELDELIKNIGKTNIRACKPKGNLGLDERTALMKLRNNSNIVIKEADKGGAVIIMKKRTIQKHGHTALTIQCA